LGAKPNNTELSWDMPSGAYIGFGHLQHEKDKYSHQGKEYAFLGFDEADHFDWSQIWYLYSRNRTTCGVRPVMRMTTNPNPDHPIKDFILWWLDENGQFPDLSKSGIIRWFVRDPEDSAIVWHDTETDKFWKILDFYKAEIDPEFEATSVAFIPASVDDNPSMPKSYKAKLMALPYIERQRLLYGDWLIKPSAGLYFRREWFKTIMRPPKNLKRLVRYWDRAATAPKKPGDDPDYTAGVLMAVSNDDQYYILDLCHFRGSPLEVETRIKSIAEQDNENFGRVEVALEQDPGQAGKSEISRYTRMLGGFNVRAYTVHKDKRTRAEPLSAQCEAGNVWLIDKPWNERLITELEGFPDMPHDDIVDACSGAFNALTNRKITGGTNWSK
jgi:predicted phage terminase large subunit-like protein